jgi:rare lipoprotein A
MAVMKHAPIAAILLSLTIFLAGCAATPPREVVAESEGCEFYQSGLASWYGNEMAIGKRGGQYIFNPTASGETFVPEAVSAAHRTLPFGSVVRVVLDRPEANPEGIMVRINDRGPFVAGRIIDLSRGAARKLGMADTQKVRVYLCESK